MRSTFFGIETMRRALLSQRTVMDTVGHNIANAGTKGYSRQIVELSPTGAFPYPGTNRVYGAGQIGTGVITESIKRVRNEFVDGQVRVGITNTAQLEVEKDTLSQIENIFLEPATTQGFSGAMTDFFDAWQEISKYPDNTAARNQVIAMGRNMVDVIRNVDQTLRDIRVDLNGQIVKDVEIVNGILRDIADLTPEIAKVFTHGMSPNDLLDQRDRLIDELSQYMNVQVEDSEYLGGLAISVGGRELMRNETVYELTLEPNWDHPSQNTKTPYMNDVSQSDYYMLAQFSTGELKGLINSRDVILPEVQEKYETMVKTFVDSVNNVHSKGLGIAVEDYSVFGAGTTAEIGNNANFAQIAATDTQYFAVGEMIQIVDQNDPSKTITVTISDIDTDGSGNGRLYFENIGPLERTVETAPGTYTNETYTIGNPDTGPNPGGAEIRKLTIDKYNFFETSDLLSNNLIGDTAPDYYNQMTSTVKLPSNVSMDTTIGDLERMFGIEIDPSGATNAPRLRLDNNSYTDQLDENMTLEEVFRRIQKVHPLANDGEALDIKFDEVNRTITLGGVTYNALAELGGENGSQSNLFRILGFEGQNITSFELQEGTQLNTTLGDLGISNGWTQIDNTLIQIDNTVTLKAALDDINAALNNSVDAKSYNTQIFYDEGNGRLRIVSDHSFSVDTPEPAIFPSTPPNAASNFLTVTGIQRSDAAPTYSKQQSLISTTTSDIGARVSVNSALMEDVNRIATASTYAGIPGDNSIAVEMAALKNAFLMVDTSQGRLGNPTQTIDDYYNDIIADVGVQSATTQNAAESADSFLEYYQNMQQEVSGVSIDEEMTKLIEAQHSYQAAARMINAVDEMLSLVINNMGLVGR